MTLPNKYYSLVKIRNMVSCGVCQGAFFKPSPKFTLKFERDGSCVCLYEGQFSSRHDKEFNHLTLHGWRPIK